MTLTIGHITYANCAPFFQYLSEAGFEGKIVPGVPSQLNRLLATGEIDASPSSSFEYGRNWRDYLLLPDLSISSAGPVQSVLLFSHTPLESLEGTDIALTGESATSINLLRILFREFLGFRQIRDHVPELQAEEFIRQGAPALLIGDRALKMAMTSPAPFIYDLGELWYRFTGLPFVFALWILRRDAAVKKREDIRRLHGQLLRSREKAFQSLETLALRVPEYDWLGTEGLVNYWRTMSYDLTPRHIEGLRLYFRLGIRHGLLPEEPEIEFFSVG